MGWRVLRQFVFGAVVVCALAGLTAREAAAQVSCSGVSAFASCTAYASGASVTYGGSKYHSIAPIPNNRDCPPNSPFSPSNDNWWVNDGTCSGGATATATRTASPTATTARATATATTARATATATTSGATATRTATATATRTSTATATATTATATATTSGDYTQGVASLNGTQAQAWFKANGFTAGYVILHYTPPGLGQQNVNMTYNSTSGRWEYTIGGLTTGGVVSYSFSYQKATVQYDTPTFSYTHGGGSATATATSRPAATATATTRPRATATTSGSTPTPTPASGGCPGCTNKRLKIINGCGQPMWIQYLNGTGGGSLSAPNHYQLATLNSYIEYDIPDIGIAGVRFWPGMGCDATGNNCTIGASGGPASMGFTCPAAGCGPPIDSKFEASFGCLSGVPSASCQQNPSAPGTPMGRIDWWNSSAVDGYTLPFQVKALGSCPVGPQPDGPGGPPGGVVSCTSIKFADCPTAENLSSNGAYPNLSSVNLKLTNPNNGAQAGCFSPAGKLTFSQWNAGFTTYPADDPHAQLYACPTPPISPTQCSSGPSATTTYTNLIHSKCTNTYAYAYDDTFGLATCPAATNMHYEVTFFCPQ